MKSKQIILIVLAIVFSCNGNAKIRVGWQVPWALQGQLVQILKHTQILKDEKIEVEFVGRTFGPELNELAMANEVDIILTADQPAATLFAKNPNWVGVSRLMYNRTATYVPTNSPIKTMADLKSKTVGIPFGAAAQRIFNEEIVRSGLNVEQDVKAINLGIQEQMPLILKSPAQSRSWDQFDAMVGFDPVPAILEVKLLARILHVGRVCSLVVANKKFLDSDKSSVAGFVRAISKAYEYYQKNTKQANAWFIEEAKSQASDEALDLAASLEPNMKSKTINLDFSDEDYKILQNAAKFVQKSTGVLVDMKSRVSIGFLK